LTKKLTPCYRRHAIRIVDADVCDISVFASVKITNSIFFFEEGSVTSRLSIAKSLSLNAQSIFAGFGSFETDRLPRIRRFGLNIAQTILIVVALILSSSSAFAFEGSTEKGLMQDLSRSKKIVESMQTKLSQGSSVKNELSELKAVADDVRISELLLEERFKITGEKIKNLGSKALARQQTAADGFKKAIFDYLSLIDSLPSNGKVSQSQITTVQTLLEKISPKKNKQILGSLPYQHLNLPSLQPSTSPSITPAYKGGDKTATSDDVATTDEAPVSPEIAALAQSLNWNPVSIYEYVKNNIDTEWYWGCMKGAEDTLHQKSGNDCDQATLLVALLRASNFPSRYVRGTVQFFPNIERAKNLTGISDPSKIADFFQKAGIPYNPVIAGGTISNLQIEHIWVESQIPYSNYRGIVIDSNGKTWLGLDTSIKVKDYTYNNAQDILSVMSFSTVRDEYLGFATTGTGSTPLDLNQTPLEYLQTKINAQLAVSQPTATYTDFLSTRTLSPEVLNLLPSSMQFTLIKATNEYTAIPDELKHKIRFTATDKANNQLFDITMDAMKLSNQQIVVSYEPETVDDQAVIDSYGGLDNTPAYLVRLRPVLKVSGERIVVAQDGLPMGDDYNLAMSAVQSGSTTTESVTSSQIIGNIAAIGIISQKSTTGSQPDQSGQQTAEQLLYNEGARYIDRWNKSEDEFVSLLQLSLARPIPTIAVIGNVLDVTYVLDQPQGITWKGVYCDALLRAAETSPKSQQSGDRDRLFMQLSSLQGSILENRIFEDDFQVESISTAKLFQIINFGAGGSGQGSANQVLTIDSSNVSDALSTLSFDDNIKSDIQNAVNQNMTVRIPQSEQSYRDWTGVGYIKENVTTGESGWMLSGVIAGSTNVVKSSDWLNQYFAQTLSTPYSGATDTNPLAAANIQKIPVTDEQDGEVGTTLSTPLTVYVSDAKGLPVKGAAVSFSISAGGGSIKCQLASSGATSTTCIAATSRDGLAKANITLGKYTSDNPSYKLYSGDAHNTQVGLNITEVSVASNNGNLAPSGPFTSYGKPGDPQTIVATFPSSDGIDVLPDNPGGSLIVNVSDQYSNPVSNSNVLFQAQQAQSILSLQTDTTFRNLKLYKGEDTSKAYPLYADISSFAKDTILRSTSYSGAKVETMIGNAENTVYPVSATVIGKFIGTSPTATYDYSTKKYARADGWMKLPTLYIQALVPFDPKTGQQIDTTKANTPLQEPLTAKLVLMSDPSTSICPVNGTGFRYQGDTCCWWYIKPLHDTTIATVVDNATVDFTPKSGGGSVNPTVNIGNGEYQSSFWAGPFPALNSVMATGTKTMTVPGFLKDDVMSPNDPYQAIPRVSTADPVSGDPTLYYISLAPNPFISTDPCIPYTTDDMPKVTIDVPTGNSIYEEENTKTHVMEPKLLDYSSLYCIGRCSPGTSQDAFDYVYNPYALLYKIWGVDTSLEVSPAITLLDENGMTENEIYFKYTVKPPDVMTGSTDTYNALSVWINLYERPAGGSGSNDVWISALPAPITQGTATVALVRGTTFDPNKQYVAEPVLNLGTSMEVRGDKVPIPIGQVQILSNDGTDTPMVGAVTDGAATLKLQLTVSNGGQSLNGALWTVSDPQISSSAATTAIVGTLVDSSNNPRTSWPVTLNNGVATATYKVPLSFVRWGAGTNIEGQDGSNAERTISIALNNTSQGLPTIRLRRTPVVLVHGLWGDGRKNNNAYSWKNFESQLNNQGLFDIVSADYHDTNADSLDTNSILVEQWIDDTLNLELKNKFAASKVDVLAHSMGGLVTRRYCSDNYGACIDHINKLVTIDTPHLGSELADLLIIYRDHVDLFPNPGSDNLIMPSCHTRVGLFVNGASILGMRIPSHPLGEAIDALASGRWAESPFNMVSSGAWSTLPSIGSQTSGVNVHTIVGLASVSGYDSGIKILWNNILEYCGFPRSRVFPMQPDDNDRIVSGDSQQGSIPLPTSTSEAMNGVDHISVLSNNNVVSRIKELLDGSSGAPNFVVGQ
jgi:pimeloyl-ACP methyl ester carboxylesterase